MAEVQRVNASAVEQMASDVTMSWGACGVVVAWSRKGKSRFPLLEWYSEPSAFRAAWSSLLRSVLDPADLGKPGPTIRLSDIENLVGKVDAPTTSEESQAGDGVTNVRFNRGKMYGWAMRHQRRLVHVCALRD